VTHVTKTYITMRLTSHKTYISLRNIHHHHHHQHRRPFRHRLSRIRLLGLFRFIFSETYQSIWTFRRTPWTGVGPTQGLYLYTTTQHRKMRTHIHASSGIGTNDPSVRAVEDSTFLRPYGHWDRLHFYQNIYLFVCLFYLWGI